MIIDEEAWLEHAGVKGMHWGERKSGDHSVAKERVKTAAKTGAKAGAAVYIASAVLVGAAFAASHMSKHGSTSLSALNANNSITRNLASRNVINATSRDVPYVKILGALGKGNGMSVPLQADVDWLEHHGVKGQKWGTRRAAKREAKARNKSLNAKSLEKDIKAREVARSRRKSGAIKAERKAAKVEYKNNKSKIGSREARKVLYEKQNKAYAEVAKSKEALTGGDVAKVLLGVGVVIAANVIANVAKG